MTVLGINIVGLMMLIRCAQVSALIDSPYRLGLRIRALYGKNRMVVWPVAALLAFEFGVNSLLLFYGKRMKCPESILKANVDIKLRSSR